MAYKYNISSLANAKLKEKEEEEKERKQETQAETTNEKNTPNEDVNVVKTLASSTQKDETENNEESQSSEKSKTTADVLSDLYKIEETYKNKDYIDAPENLGLDTVDVPEKSQDELTAIAKASLNQKYGEKKQTTTDNFAKQIDSLLSSMDTYKKSAQTKSNEINNLYDQSIKETENQALKRGLARSSIIISEISGLEGSRANELSSVLSSLNDSLTSVENQMVQLESEKDIALANLDLEYAEELEAKIADVQEEYLKARQAAIDFNNDVAKLESEYKLKLDQQKTDKINTLTKLESNYGSDYTDSIIIDKQFDYLKAYFDTLEPTYALDLLLTNKEIKSILKNRYSEMYKYLASR